VTRTAAAGAVDLCINIVAADDWILFLSSRGATRGWCWNHRYMGGIRGQISKQCVQVTPQSGEKRNIDYS
jgi:hypothetical protein